MGAMMMRSFGAGESNGVRASEGTRRVREKRAAAPWPRKRRRALRLAAAQVDNVEATAKHLTKVFADERVHARV